MYALFSEERLGRIVPPGPDKEKRARFPTTEVLGYCQMSLRDRNAVYFLQSDGLHPMRNGPHTYRLTLSSFIWYSRGRGVRKLHTKEMLS